MTDEDRKIRNVKFFKDRIEFDDCYGDELVLYKSDRSLAYRNPFLKMSLKTRTISEKDCELVFGPGWMNRVDDPEESKPVDPSTYVVKDMVDKPAHYSRYGVETIDAMRGTMSPEEFNGFLKGNAFKYLTRAGAKDALEQDLHKVCWYTMFLYLVNGGTVEALGQTLDYMKERFAK